LKILLAHPPTLAWPRMTATVPPQAQPISDARMAVGLMTPTHKRVASLADACQIGFNQHMHMLECACVHATHVHRCTGGVSSAGNSEQRRCPPVARASTTPGVLTFERPGYQRKDGLAISGRMRAVWAHVRSAWEPVQHLRALWPATARRQGGAGDRLVSAVTAVCRRPPSGHICRRPPSGHIGCAACTCS